MKFAEFAGADEKLSMLMRSAQAGRIVHALLFAGPHGTGKRSMAELFARAALCQSEHEELRPCDECAACKRCINGTHPDIHLIAPEKNIIKVDQIRALVETLGMAAYEGGRKIAIIEHADCMNESAQNALLKTLENPVGDALFFLLTDTAGALLPTIQSRCLQLRFNCLEAGACADVLIGRGVEPAHARLLAGIAQGSVGRALEIDADDKYLALRDKLLGAMCQLRAPQDIARVTAAIGTAKGRENDMLEMLELWARDLMRVQNGMEPEETDQAEALGGSSLCGSVLLQNVQRLRRELHANVSWSNAFETMCMRLVDAGL